MLRSSARASAFAMTACLFLTGCGGSGTVAVSGTLTYKGKPVTNAVVNFTPDDNGRPSSATTDKDGKFTLQYDPETKGAKPGKYKVYVMHNVSADAARPGAVPGMPAPMAGDEKELFNKYSSAKSTVTVEITKSESNLELKWD